LSKVDNTPNTVWAVIHITGEEKGFPVADNDRIVTLENEKRGILGARTVTHRQIPLALLTDYYFKIKTV
jgi:hypothetical protein